MRTPITLTVAAAGALLVGCQHPSPVPGGTGQYLEAPTGVVDALPEGVYEGIHDLAVLCEGGDFSACGRLAYRFEHGAESSYHGSHGGGHGDDAHADDDHGDDEHADDAHAEDDGHGEEHAEGDDHGDDSHGGGHGYGETVDLEPNPAMAETLYRVSCDAGWESSCVAVAHLRLEAGGSAEMMEAESLMAGACERGMTEACYELAGLYLDGSLPGSVGAAMPLLHDACARGLSDACSELSARMR